MLNHYWEVAGVQMVNDVLPWEEMKLRMLNGSHSFLAYLGYLSRIRPLSVIAHAGSPHSPCRRRTLMLDEPA